MSGSCPMPDQTPEEAAKDAVVRRSVAWENAPRALLVARGFDAGLAAARTSSELGAGRVENFADGGAVCDSCGAVVSEAATDGHGTSTCFACYARQAESRVSELRAALDKLKEANP